MWIGQLSLVLTLLYVAGQVKSSVVLVNDGMAVEWTPDDVTKDTCQIYHHSLVPKNNKVTHVTRDVLHENLQQCWRTHVVKRDTPLALSLPWKHKTTKRPKADRGITYPGTKWCGPGDRAKSYSDLGHFKHVDSCCRSHDHCPDHLLAGQSGYGLNNTALVTLTSCGCDSKFRQCLKSHPSVHSTAIGTIFFDIVKEKCFRIIDGQGHLEYPEPFSSAGEAIEHTEETIEHAEENVIDKVKKMFHLKGHKTQKEAPEDTEEAPEHTRKSFIDKVKKVFHLGRHKDQ